MSDQYVGHGYEQIPLALSGMEPSPLPVLPPIKAASSPPSLRWICAASGVAALFTLGFVGDGVVAARLAEFALLALGLATAIGWWQLMRSRQMFPTVVARSGLRVSRTWLWTVIAVVLVTGLGVQTWFQPGKTIATGDNPPPDGTGWLHRLFEPWVWSGASLGEPSQLSMNLPWAGVLGLVHALGGQPDLAQRIWYTTLFVAAALAALGFMAALGLGPIPALVGAVVYVLNPYVVSAVNVYAVYLVALGLLAAEPAVLLAVGTGRLSTRWGVALIAASSPMLGYVFFNPPLLGMIIATMLATPLFVAWFDGRDAALRSSRALLLAVPLSIAASAYWVVPAIVHVSGAPGTQLASLSSWTWTETRATVRNAFWLNAIWSWPFREYYPYAAAYESLPLSLARFVLPAMAFGALCLERLTTIGSTAFVRDRLSRIAVAAAAVALIVIFVSTGTNPPGSLLFDRLYSLPFGWLIREPGRFLMVAALAYAVLATVACEALLQNSSVLDFLRLRRLSVGAFGLLYVPTAIATCVLVGFPLYTGAIVTDQRPSLPPVHVRVPSYWTKMARLVDGLPIQGNVLVMPPDDFYQMPYTWGYYGSDGFVVELFQRGVLVPNGQGYSPATSQVITAVNLTAQSILHGNWHQAEALMTALNTSLILVRRDIDVTFPGRSIVPPNDLADALSRAPNFVLVQQIGALDLFALRTPLTESEVTSNFITINSQTPDLRLVSLLPIGTAIVSSQSLPGVPSMEQAPPLEMWQPNGNALEWRPNSPRGSVYRIADLDKATVISLDRAGTVPVDNGAWKVTYTPSQAGNTVIASVTGRTAISDGDFVSGSWGPVGDCQSASPTPNLSADVISNAAPGGLPALRLAASSDSACVKQTLTWHGGALVVSLMVRNVEGSPPRICLWEFGANRCAQLPDMPSARGWVTFRASIRPDPGTTSLYLYLYADGRGQSGRTTNEYADIRVAEVPELPRLVLFTMPGSQPNTPLLLDVLHNTYSSQWGASTGRHVEVDGMLNGWLVQMGSGPFRPSYLPSSGVTAAQWISAMSLLIIIILAALPLLRLGAGRMAPRVAKRLREIYEATIRR
jgi:arabinofuranan 3-O-arabinosyltransferase